MCLPLLDQCPLCYGLQPARAAALEVIHQPRLRDSPGATGTGEVVDHQVVYLPATAEAHRRKRDPMSSGSARTVAPELNIGGDRPVCSCVAAFPGQQEVATSGECGHSRAPRPHGSLKQPDGCGIEQRIVSHLENHARYRPCSG
jgi:hypothetical protein